MLDWRCRVLELLLRRRRQPYWLVFGSSCWILRLGAWWLIIFFFFVGDRWLSNAGHWLKQNVAEIGVLFRLLVIRWEELFTFKSTSIGFVQFLMDCADWFSFCLLQNVVVLDPDLSKDYLDRIQNRSKEKRYCFDHVFGDGCLNSVYRFINILFWIYCHYILFAVLISVLSIFI